MDEQEYEIDLLDLCKAVFARWKLIILCTLAATAVAVAGIVVKNLGNAQSAHTLTSASALISVDIRSGSKSYTNTSTDTSSDTNTTSGQTSSIKVSGDSALLGSGLDIQEESTSNEKNSTKSQADTESTTVSGTVVDRINTLAKLDTLCRVLLTRGQVVREIAQQCDTTVELVEESISVGVLENTNLLRINVAAGDPTLSLRICGQLASMAPDILLPALEADSVEVIEVVSDDELPFSMKAEKNDGKYCLIAALIGFLLPCAYVVLDYLLNPRVRTEGDIQRRLGLKLLGTVPGGKEKRTHG